MDKRNWKKSKHTPESLLDEMQYEGVKLEESLHETLGKDAIPALQGMMSSRAEQLYPVSKRFLCTPGSDGRGNNMDITDTLTGRMVNVGLCNYHGARAVLQAFFPDEI